MLYYLACNGKCPTCAHFMKFVLPGIVMLSCDKHVFILVYASGIPVKPECIVRNSNL